MATGGLSQPEWSPCACINAFNFVSFVGYFCSLSDKSSKTTCLSKKLPSELAAIKGGEPLAVERVERLVLHPAPVKVHVLVA